MFRAIYRRLTKKKRPRNSLEQSIPTAVHFQSQSEGGTEEAIEMMSASSSDEQPTDNGAHGDSDVASTNDAPSSTTTLVPSEGQQDPVVVQVAVQVAAKVADPAQLKVLAGRQQIAKLLIRLCNEEEGNGDANQIVMELLGCRKSVSLPVAFPWPTVASPSAIERVSEQLMGVLPVQTMAEAGIANGNERYRCFKSVLQNYTKIYAARRFMEKLPMLGEVGPAGEVLARVAANEVLQIPELLRQLWSSLDKMEFFNEDTAFKAFLEARRHPQARILRELMLTRISRVFLCIVSSTIFQEFTELELLHILRHCYLSVNSEIEIFLSVVLWMEHNWMERSECAERLLAEVRFGLMPTWYLSTLERANRCYHFKRVIRSPGVQRMIAQGLEDAVTLKAANPRSSYNAGEGSKEGSKPQMKPLEEAHMPRDWIADTECRHHHKCHCENFVYPTYDVFKEYLAKIIFWAPNYWRTFRPAQEVYRNEFRCCSQQTFH